MQYWDITGLDVEVHRPQVVSSSGDARAIVLHLPAGESLQEHEVHERAFLMVASGEVEVSSVGGDGAVTGRAGLLFEFDPHERRVVTARADSRLLLLLAPWPGEGHQVA
jgi:redox-sensitive bicupin YhaK (pirin superfamily)